MRHGLLILDDLGASYWQQGSASADQMFGNSPEHRQACADFLKSESSRSRLRVITNFSSESFSHEMLPRLSMTEKRRLISLRCQQRLESQPWQQNSCIRHPGHPGEVLIIHSAGSRQHLDPWLDALKNVRTSIIGIWSLSALLPGLLPRAQRSWHLIASQHAECWRLSLIQGGRVRHTRWLHGQPEDVAALIHQFTQQSQRLGLSPDKAEAPPQTLIGDSYFLPRQRALATCIQTSAESLSRIIPRRAHRWPRPSFVPIELRAARRAEHLRQAISFLSGTCLLCSIGTGLWAWQQHSAYTAERLRLEEASEALSRQQASRLAALPAWLSAKQAMALADQETSLLAAQSAYARALENISQELANYPGISLSTLSWQQKLPPWQAGDEVLAFQGTIQADGRAPDMELAGFLGALDKHFGKAEYRMQTRDDAQNDWHAVFTHQPGAVH